MHENRATSVVPVQTGRSGRVGRRAPGGAGEEAGMVHGLLHHPKVLFRNNYFRGVSDAGRIS